MDRANIEAALNKKGFVCKEKDHRYYYHQVDGKYTGIQTKVSTGTKYKRLGPPLVAKIKKQLQLDSPKDFNDFVNCPMTKNDYNNKLAEKGVIRNIDSKD